MVKNLVEISETESSNSEAPLEAGVNCTGEDIKFLRNTTLIRNGLLVTAAIAFPILYKLGVDADYAAISAASIAAVGSFLGVGQEGYDDFVKGNYFGRKHAEENVPRTLTYHPNA